MQEWNNPIESGPIPASDEAYDVIVVGGGPGGAAAAGYHSMAGSRVLLLEKEVWPRDKICGDAVGGKSLSHVAELGVKPMIERLRTFELTLLCSPRQTDQKFVSCYRKRASTG